MESNILGLDLGPNSIGWAVMKGIVTKGYVPSLTGIAGAGSRILPMDAAMLGNFEKGKGLFWSKKQTIQDCKTTGNEIWQLCICWP